MIETEHEPNTYRKISNILRTFFHEKNYVRILLKVFFFPSLMSSANRVSVSLFYYGFSQVQQIFLL